MTTPAGWYPATDGQERYWDGSEWTTARRPSGSAPTAGKREITPLGKFTRMLALGTLAAGLYVGYGMHVTAVGAASTSLDDLAKAHAVDCGTAFHLEFSSVSCEQALSGRKTTATVLIISSVGMLVAAGTLMNEPAT